MRDRRDCDNCGGPLGPRQRRYCSPDCYQAARKESVGRTDYALVEHLAANGCSLDTIASRLGLSRRTLQRRREEDEALQDAIERGRAAEHDELVGLLLDKARKGDTTAILFALKARHGYREGEPLERSNGVAVQIVLPAAMSREQYQATLEGEVVTDGGDAE